MSTLARHALESLETLSEEELIANKEIDTFDNYKDAIVAMIAHRGPNSDISDALRVFNVDMLAILRAKAA